MSNTAPTITLVPSPPVVETEAPVTADSIIQKLAVDHITGKKINIYDVIECANWPEQHQELIRVREWLFENRVCGKRDWQEAVKRKRAKEKLGEYPNTPREYVDMWVKRERVTASYKKTLSRYRIPKLNGEIITQDSMNDQGIKNLANARIKDEMQMLDFHRELRNEAFELGLPFPNKAIEDAADMWFHETYPQRRDEVYLDVQYQRGLATGPAGQQNWDRLIASSFDTERVSKEFIEACLKKFIWQVKRKMVNISVTHHLMLVIVGAQGKGKTEFVKKLIAPVAELSANTDFRMITDNRNIDLWRNYVLFMDEMSSSSKSDMDVVKNLITAETLTLRPMRSNDQIHVRQNATFIGCANKELSQMIKDETGIRRFVALNFSNTPDWAACDQTDWKMLWRSVDENGPDPMGKLTDELRQLQEESRSRGPVETWLEQRTPNKKWMFIPDLYDEYKLWADRYYPGSHSNVEWFKGEFRRIVRDSNTYEGQRKGPKGYQYRLIQEILDDSEKSA